VIPFQIQLHSETIRIKEFFRGSLERKLESPSLYKSSPVDSSAVLNDLRSDLARGWRNRRWRKAEQVGLYRWQIPQEKFAEAKPGTESPQNPSAQLPFRTLLG
jgi:hypothetical protein